MSPLFNSLPYRPNQVHTDGKSTSSAAQQVNPSNHSQQNPSNLFPNSAQVQCQMGMTNPQIATPFNNSNTHLGNGPGAMPNGPISAPMGAPNHPLPQQNGMPLMGSASGMLHLGQFHGAFRPQNSNSMPMAPMNPIQLPSQFFPHNSVNLPQYLSQNAVFLNGQLCLQNPMQNINQFVLIPMSNYAQVVPCNIQQYPNQVSQALAPQNPAFLANPQFRPMHSTAVVHTSNRDQHKVVPSTMVTNVTRQSHTSTQQSERNSPLPPAFGSVLPQQTHKDFHPPVSTESQENLKKDGGIINLKNNWKNTQNRNFKQNRRDASQRGFSKSHFHNMQNTKGSFRFHNKYRGKGYENDWARTCELADSTNPWVGQRRFISLNYTEQEIQQWREERKKNYPSKYNIEKKLAEKPTEPEVMERDAKIRRQQLKEILAKQAELGCEVAEIPSGYLSDLEKQGQGKELDKRTSAKKERFQNKFNKRGRFSRNKSFSKKQRLADHDSSNVPNQDEQFSYKTKLADNGSCTKPSSNRKQPTLLQRLLSADIRRDKHRLLQVFRFMVMNYFFKGWPENPLSFPSVVVNDTAAGEVIEEKLSSYVIGASQVYDKTIIEEWEYGAYHGDRGANDEDDKNCDDERIVQVKEVHFATLKGSIGGEAMENEEEEGEYID